MSTTTTTARDRGPLWPHRMGRTKYSSSQIWVSTSDISLLQNLRIWPKHGLCVLMGKDWHSWYGTLIAQDWSTDAWLVRLSSCHRISGLPEYFVADLNLSKNMWPQFSRKSKCWQNMTNPNIIHIFWFSQIYFFKLARNSKPGTKWILSQKSSRSCLQLVANFQICKPSLIIFLRNVTVKVRNNKMLLYIPILRI